MEPTTTYHLKVQWGTESQWRNIKDARATLAKLNQTSMEVTKARVALARAARDYADAVELALAERGITGVAVQTEVELQ